MTHGLAMFQGLCQACSQLSYTARTIERNKVFSKLYSSTTEHPTTNDIGNGMITQTPLCLDSYTNKNDHNLHHQTNNRTDQVEVLTAVVVRQGIVVTLTAITAHCSDLFCTKVCKTGQDSKKNILHQNNGKR